MFDCFNIIKRSPMLKSFLILVACFAFNYTFSQEINPDILHKVWNASWIDYPNTKPNDYGVYHFRKEFLLNEKPQQFIVHVSADNRYKLYVNDSLVAFGPAKGDLYHWNFETIDIANYLNKGNNVIASVVWNFGDEKPVWQISYRTAFILQGDTKTEEIINTDTSWKCIPDKAYSPLQPDLVYSYYAIGATEKVNMNAYPQNWTDINFDDKNWMNAHEILMAFQRM